MNDLKEYFPDGTVIDDWFYDTKVPALEELGKKYVITEYGVMDDGRVYTEAIQRVIDIAAVQGGGVVVIPAGTYLTGALYFKQGVNLYVGAGATLKGSDDISDYNIVETRIEGETCMYVDALINADGVDGFTMCGPGTIDGNGLRSWKAFWQRRAWNNKCTNKDEQRSRLVYISNSSNVLVAGLNLQNSQFWTNHIYRSHHIKFIGCRIFSPAKPVKAPSTDAIDIDVCHDFLIKNCYLEVNDDSVVLKGGKGPWADEAPENGMNERVIVEDCVYGYCHGCLTCGSECIHNKNIIVRRLKAMNASNLLWLKMRTDTHQINEYIRVENVDGKLKNFIKVFSWSQFFDLKGRTDMPKSEGHHITMRNCECECETFFNVTEKKEQYDLYNFTFENLNIRAENGEFEKNIIKDFSVREVTVNGEKK